MVSPVHGDYRRYQAETPLIALSKFPRPALSKSLSAIRGGALEAVREELSVFLGKMREQKEETVSRYVIDQAPEYRRLLKTHGTRVLEVLPANPKPKDIDAALGRVWVERQSDLKEGLNDLLHLSHKTL
jgi:hypothetical protein